MKKSIFLFLAVCLILSCAPLAFAQQQEGPPKVLTIFREFVKPGKSGTTHEKAEAAFVQASKRAKWPQHYLALTSASGPDRALFLSGYDSLEAWEKDRLATEKNAAFAAELDRAAVADGELLSSTDSGTFLYREDLSYRTKVVDIAHMRYFSIVIVHVRPGHVPEFTEIVKLFNDTRDKAGLDDHVACYQVHAGGHSIFTYLFFAPLKSLAQVDDRTTGAYAKAFDAAMGDEGRKKLNALSSAAVESVERQLFIFSPKMSYPPDEWVKADPDFWQPKPKPAAKAAAEGEKAPKKQARKP